MLNSHLRDITFVIPGVAVMDIYDRTGAINALKRCSGISLYRCDYGGATEGRHPTSIIGINTIGGAKHTRWC